jgi:hypothetical protein
MESSEPTYVATTVFENKQQFDEYDKKKKQAATPLKDIRFAKAPETVYYEGTLMLSAP